MSKRPPVPSTKSPGKDKVSNFWLKHLVILHEDLAKAYTKVIEHPEEAPEWLTEGITYLLPKTEETKNPKNYRPITCLPTMCKILTSIIAERTYTFLNEHQLLPSEEKGCKKGRYGCKDQLLINKMILEDCKTKKKNLSTAWIDYKKQAEETTTKYAKRIKQMARNKTNEKLKSSGRTKPYMEDTQRE